LHVQLYVIRGSAYVSLLVMIDNPFVAVWSEGGELQGD